MSRAWPAAVRLAGGATAVRVEAQEDLGRALAALGLSGSRPVIVVVGGAGALADEDLARLQPLLAEALLPVAGSGRAADDLAAALTGAASEQGVTALAASGLLTVVPVGDPAALAGALAAALALRR